MIVIITQCFPPAIGGIENLMGGAAKALRARGHDIVVLADGHKGHVDESGCFGSVRYFDGWKPLRRWRKAKALRHLLKGGAVRAVLADSWKSIETLARSGAPTGDAAIVCFAHGNEFPEKPSSLKVQRIASAMSRVTKVIANSRFTADRVKQYVGSDFVVVRAPPIGEVDACSADDRLWAEQIWEKGTPRLLSLCRLEPLKGIDHTISSIATLVGRYPSLQYVVAGSGDDLGRLKELVTRYKLEAHVVFAGSVGGSKKSALYESADLFLMPTRRVGLRQEAFGMVYLEAALHGLPVIGGRAGGAEDAVLDGQTGILVDGADTLAIAECIDRLLIDDAYRSALGEAASVFAQRFTWSEQIAALESDLS